MYKALFALFDEGTAHTPAQRTQLQELPWHEHKQFADVFLKHVITSNDTEGQFSCHLVRIAPNKSIGLHTHEQQVELHEVIQGSGTCIMANNQLQYTPGVIAIMPRSALHQVNAGDNGMLLFAKFIPALC